jgi:hypothetical protein
MIGAHTCPFSFPFVSFPPGFRPFPRPPMAQEGADELTQLRGIYPASVRIDSLKRVELVLRAVYRLK